MKLDTVLLKVASRCNLDCSYCYVYHSNDQGWRSQPSRMSLQTIDAVIERLIELKESTQQPLSVVLHGGEPLLLGNKLLEKLLLELRSGLGAESRIALQTNGTLLTDELIELFATTQTAVGVSIDGPATVNDKFRLDHFGKSTFNPTLDAIKRLRDHPKSSEFFCGTLSVIDPFSDVEDIYQFFKSLRVPSMDFLLQDGNHETLPYGKGSFNTLEYGRWLTRLWELYTADPEPVPIVVLDNIFYGLFGKQSTKEGSGVNDYGILVIDTDGTIKKNDTLKSSFDGADLFSENWSIHSHSIVEIIESEEFNRYKAQQKTSHKECLNCPYLSSCGGGMVLHRWSQKNKYDNPSIYCQDQKLISSKMVKGTLESLKSLPDLSHSRSFNKPFPHAWIPSPFPSWLNNKILTWLECTDQWKCIKTDFYHQYEFDLKQMNLPNDLNILTSKETLSHFESWLQDTFNTTTIETTEITVHMLEAGQGIGLHNDCSSTDETVRLLLQFNRGIVGGDLALFNDSSPDSVCRIIKPIHGTAFAFTISQESYHAVPTIKEGRRFTIVYSFRPCP